MAEVQRSEDILSSDLVDVPTGASAASDVAAVSYSLDADIERSGALSLGAAPIPACLAAHATNPFRPCVRARAAFSST